MELVLGQLWQEVRGRRFRICRLGEGFCTTREVLRPHHHQVAVQRFFPELNRWRTFYDLVSDDRFESFEIRAGRGPAFGIEVPEDLVRFSRTLEGPIAQVFDARCGKEREFSLFSVPTGPTLREWLCDQGARWAAVRPEHGGPLPAFPDPG